MDMEKFKGKVVLIANVASKCGYTDKGYQDLNFLYDHFNTQPFEVIGVPCNQFMNQEPEENYLIEMFARRDKGSPFKLTEKVDVNGDKAHDLFRFLKGEFLPANHKDKTRFSGKVGWNFEFFLVDKKGNVVNRWPTGTDMSSPEVQAAIIDALVEHPKLEL